MKESKRLPAILKSIWLATFLLCFCSAAAIECAAQKPSRDAAPRVGTIKDYPATGLMTGCANLYFEFPNRAAASSDNYVFLSRSHGEDAWMNLNGRDTRLILLKTTIRHKADGTTQRWRYDYRAGKTRVSVFIEPNDKAEDYMFEMKIILRKGRASRVVKAVGSADC